LSASLSCRDCEGGGLCCVGFGGGGDGGGGRVGVLALDGTAFVGALKDGTGGSGREWGDLVAKKGDDRVKDLICGALLRSSLMIGRDAILWSVDCEAGQSIAADGIDILEHLSGMHLMRRNPVNGSC
jgi:hypothetical protein